MPPLGLDPEHTRNVGQIQAIRFTILSFLKMICCFLENQRVVLSSGCKDFSMSQSTRT
jgi:hypothetical protein